jgi:hypothetical protein
MNYFRKRKVKKDLRTKRDALCYSVVKFFLGELGDFAGFARKIFRKRFSQKR